MSLYNIPVRLIIGLKRYADHHIPTGDFLKSVLENDLVSAILRADEESLKALPEIIRYCYWELPGPSWGSSEKVAAWLSPTRPQVSFAGELSVKKITPSESSLCTVCHANFVDTSEGYDTCDDCLRRR